MDSVVLLGSFALLIAIGMPVAYSLGLAALVAALWIELPLGFAIRGRAQFQDVLLHDENTSYLTYFNAGLRVYDISDERLVKEGYVALTPIHIDLTARHCMHQVEAWNVDY